MRAAENKFTVELQSLHFDLEHGVGVANSALHRSFFNLFFINLHRYVAWSFQTLMYIDISIYRNIKWSCSVAIVLYAVRHIVSELFVRDILVFCDSNIL